MLVTLKTESKFNCLVPQSARNLKGQRTRRTLFHGGKETSAKADFWRFWYEKLRIWGERRDTHAEFDNFV